MARHAAMGLVVFLGLLVAYGFWGFSYDDNFITYRYAQNLSRGEGLVYNPAEAVLGTSAPGYAVLLGALALVGRPFGLDVPAWGTLVSLLSLMVVLVLLRRAAREGEHDAPEVLMLMAAAVVLLLPLTLQLLGAEGFVVLALVAVSTDALFRARRPIVAGLLIAAAMAVRLDAGLAAASLGLVAWRRARRFPWHFAMTGIGSLLPWLWYLHTTFGRVVPHTLEGKTALREVPYTLRTWQLLDNAIGLSGSAALVLAAALGLAAAYRLRWHRQPSFQALALWLVGHELAYRLIGVWFAPWYEIYLLVSVSILAAMGAVFWAERGWRALRPVLPDVRRTGAITVLALMLLAPILIQSVRFTATNWRRPPDPRAQIYTDAGRFLRDETPAGSTVLAYEIGVLGFVAERPILDLGALVSPQFVAPKFAETRPAAAAAAHPDYIVDIETNPLMRRVLAHEGIREDYSVAAVFRDSRFGGGTVSVWQRH